LNSRSQVQIKRKGELLQGLIPIRLRPKRNLGISSASVSKCVRPSSGELQSLPQPAVIPLSTTPQLRIVSARPINLN